MKNIINILFDDWQGHNPLYWESEEGKYFSYGNINSKIYPPKYPGYRVLQKVIKLKNKYKVENQYLYNNQLINEEDFKNAIPIQQYICRPIRFKNQFVYRIHLQITLSSDFFDLLDIGYYIRKTQNAFHPKENYDPFIFSMTREDTYIYISPEKKIAEIIDVKTYPYVARDFIIEAKNIKTFMQYMKTLGYEPKDFIESQEDLYEQFTLIEKKIMTLKKEYKDHELKKKYIHRIFKCTDKNQLKKLKSEIYTEFTSIRNIFSVLWDEAFELKNIYQKFKPIKKSNNVDEVKINDLYNNINKQSLDETSIKNEILKNLIDIVKWKNQFIDSISDRNPVKKWFISSTEPLYVFANQLEIKDTTGFDKLNQYHHQLIFSDDKYALTIGQDGMHIRLIKQKDNQSHQEEIKSLLEEYKNTSDIYIKRRIQKKIKHLKFVLKMINEIKTFL